MSLLVDGHPLDDPQNPFIIAEISGNHSLDYAKALELVKAAAQAGATACKFQTMDPETIAADIPFPYGHHVEHDAWARGLGVERLPDLFRHAGLPRDWHVPLKSLAESLGLIFLSTPFSVPIAKFLVEDVGVSALKIASGDLPFTALLEYATATGLPLIVSTGGATWEECYHACDEPLGDAWLGDRLVLLHCVSSYPATTDMMNLRCITTLRETLEVPVGLSDHTLDTVRIPAAACALGATTFEKHIRLAGDTTSVDAGHALDPTQFATYVQTIRETCLALGDGVKAPQEAERHDVLWARRGSDGLRPTDEARQGRWA